MNSTYASMAGEIEHAETGTHERLVHPRGSFFLTLSPVVAPIPVPPPTSPGLQRFRFFFTRRREDGRERCWLHFGHFRTVGEAHKWLKVLRKIYPNAVMREVPETYEAPAARNPPAPGEPKSLSDTQVLALLKKNENEGAQTPGRQASSPVPERPRGVTLEDTLNELMDSASDTMKIDDDSASSTGVRHLRVELQKRSRTSRREKGRPASTSVRKS
jgi:hypothetical protein